MTTYGEKLVDKLLKSLPKDKYFYKQEPTISSQKSAYRNPDFVIVNATLGVIVLEVKDWKQILEVTQENTKIRRNDGTMSVEKNPVRIAREYALNLSERFKELDELLAKHRGKTVLKFPWMYAVALPHIDKNTIRRIEKKGIWEAGCVFSREDLAEVNFEKALYDLPWPWKLKRYLDKSTLDVIRGVLDPRVIIEDTKGQVVGIITIPQEKMITLEDKPTQKSPLEYVDELFTDEANMIIENASVWLVRGVAGSGKSLVLARRAQRLAEASPDQNMLVTTFNVDLVEDLKRRIPGAPNLEITNFHKLCSQILARKWQSPVAIDSWLENNAQTLLTANNLSIEFAAQEMEWRKELEIYDNAAYLDIQRDGRGKSLSRPKRAIINRIFDQYTKYHYEHNIVDWSDVPRIAIAQLQQGHPLRHKYDVILIDEAQDFAPSWVEVIKRLLKPDGSLFMCDDPTQSLFRSFSWRQKGVEVTGRTRRLKVPFRNTRQITDAAYSLIKGDNDLSHSEEITTPDLTSYTLADGDIPTLVRCRNLTDEVKFVAEHAQQLAQSGISANQIAILCHSKRIVKHWAHLRNHGFYVETFNRMKGLEFQAVFLPHLQNSFEQSEQIKEKDGEFISETRRRLFTAMTRARSKLTLSYHGDFPVELTPVEPYVKHDRVQHPS